MSFTTSPFAPTFGTKQEVTVTASAGTPQSLGQLSGPVQARLVNHDTVKVAFATGAQSVVNGITLTAANMTLTAGRTEIITIMPNPDGSAVYWNIISAASPAGNKFEVVLGQGF